MEKEKCTAVILAAGQGKRMGTKVQKQYLELEGYPVIYYTLREFQESEIIDDIILVTGAGQIPYCTTEIVEKYHFDKVRTVVEGGKERFHSVWNGLCALADRDGYVFIHDGARPFADGEILRRAYDAVREYRACVVGMPVKDTIKIADEEGFADETPDRRLVWQIQTPQVFEAELICRAYAALMAQEDIQVTDDAMVVEQTMDIPVRLVEGSYENIKITTPEDLEIARVFVNKRRRK